MSHARAKRSAHDAHSDPHAHRTASGSLELACRGRSESARKTVCAMRARRFSSFVAGTASTREQTGHEGSARQRSQIGPNAKPSVARMGTANMMKGPISDDAATHAVKNTASAASATYQRRE